MRTWMTAALCTAVGLAAAAVPVAASAGTIRWGACPPSSAELDPRQQCATVRVPLDYADPGGRQIELAVSRIPATEPLRLRGVLLLNPGGPGTEGLGMPGTFTAQAGPGAGPLAAYDLVGFDPRGVGRSAPVTCGLTPAETAVGLPLPAPDGSIDANVDYARSAARRCAAASGDVLPFITTGNTARDLDQIRRALGEERISYYGGSYGTYLGAVYASLFPARTDRMVLDSAVDPATVWYDQFRTQGAGMTARFPDLGEPAETYLALVSRLDSRPVALEGLPVPLDGNAVRYLTFNLLYQDAALPYIPQAWAAAAALADGRASAEQVSLLQAVFTKIAPAVSTSPGVPADNALAAAYAIACGEGRWPVDVSVYRRNVRLDRARYPLSGGFAANLWPCAFWETPATRPTTIAPSGPRVLVLQNERDPATPLASGRGMREALGDRARLVTVDAGGHGVYGMHGACADDIVDAYLVDGAWPARDTSCSS